MQHTLSLQLSLDLRLNKPTNITKKDLNESTFPKRSNVSHVAIISRGRTKTGFHGFVDRQEVQASEADIENFASGQEIVDEKAIASRYHIPDLFRRLAMNTPRDINRKQCNLRITDTARRDPEDTSEDTTLGNIKSNSEPEGEGEGGSFEIKTSIPSFRTSLRQYAWLTTRDNSLYQRPAYFSGTIRATDMCAYLILPDLEEMEALAGEFADQETKRKLDDINVPDNEKPNHNAEFGLFKHYFAVRSKCKETDEA